MGFIESKNENGFSHERRDGHACDLSFELRGRLAPFLEVTLGAGEGLICDRTCVLQHEFDLTVKPWPGLGGSRWLVVNASQEPEASVMLSTAEAGFAGAFELSAYGGKLICLAENLMANGPGVTASYYARFQKMGLSLVLLEGNGWAFLRSRGDVFEYKMMPGEKICIRAQNVAAMTATVNFEPNAVMPDVAGANGQPEFVTLTGPGTIWMQSVSRVVADKQPVIAMPDYLAAQEKRAAGLAFMNGTVA